MATITTGYKQDHKGSYIEKDPNAQLVYTIDWGAEWLSTGDELNQVSYTLETIQGDSNPLEIVSQGIQDNKSYVELKNGSHKNVYTVTCEITTKDNNTDLRRFRIKCEERYA